MTERLTYEAIEETVGKAKEQACRMIERNLRNAIDDFENSNSTGFKLTLTIEGERNGRNAMLTLQTKAQSAVDIKRKDQTQAEVVDWGPQLFDPDKVETIPSDDDEAQSGPKLLCSASPVCRQAAADAGFMAPEPSEDADQASEDDAPQDEDAASDTEPDDEGADAVPAPEDDEDDDLPGEIPEDND